MEWQVHLRKLRCFPVACQKHMAFIESVIDKHLYYGKFAMYKEIINFPQAHLFM